MPPTISLSEVRSAILAVNGVLSVHELHVWQLSENKIVASVHVMASRSHDFMPVAAKIRKALHHRGIHSSTIQPEYHGHNGPPEDHLKVCIDPFHIGQISRSFHINRRQRTQAVSFCVLLTKPVSLKMPAAVRSSLSRQTHSNAALSSASYRCLKVF